MVAEALAAASDPNSARVQGELTQTDTGSSTLGWGTRIRQILLTGVSYMIPFVAAGGLLIALGFLFAGADVANKPAGQSDSLAHRSRSAIRYRIRPPEIDPISRRGPVHPRRAGVQLSGARTGRLHIVRHRRPSWYRRGSRRAPSPGVRGGGFIGGIVGGLVAGFAALWIGRLLSPMVPGIDAGGDHSARSFLAVGL